MGALNEPLVAVIVNVVMMLLAIWRFRVESEKAQQEATTTATHARHVLEQAIAVLDERFRSMQKVLESIDHDVKEVKKEQGRLWDRSSRHEANLAELNVLVKGKHGSHSNIDATDL